MIQIDKKERKRHKNNWKNENDNLKKLAAIFFFCMIILKL